MTRASDRGNRDGRVVTAQIVPDDDAGRERAVEALRGGAVVALPTDTVYGLGVALSTPGGIERLFHVKHRPPEKGIVLLLADAAQAHDLAIVTPAAETLAGAFWPGGLTLVLERRADVELPAALTGGASTIGLRVPDHDAPRALARALGPLPVTSANVSGQPEASTAAEILALHGPRHRPDPRWRSGAPGGIPSTVVDASGPAVRILRAGAIARAAASRRRWRPTADRSIRRAIDARRPDPAHDQGSRTLDRDTRRPQGWRFVGRYPSMRRRAPAAPAAPRPRDTDPATSARMAPIAATSCPLLIRQKGIAEP